MNELKRFTGRGLTEAADGEWVRYADIERDLQELAVLRAALGRQPIDEHDRLP